MKQRSSFEAWLCLSLSLSISLDTHICVCLITGRPVNGKESGTLLASPSSGRLPHSFDDDDDSDEVYDGDDENNSSNNRFYNYEKRE